jgi:hypothetical protein
MIVFEEMLPETSTDLIGAKIKKLQRSMAVVLADVVREAMT